MNRRFHLAICLLLGASIPVLAQDPQIVYVSSKQAKIHKEANLSSDIVAVLNKSDPVEVVKQQKVWMQIRETEVSGWVSRYSLSNSKPAQEKLSIFSRLKKFFENDNRRVRLAFVSTAGGVRDLTEEESDAAGKTDFKALRALESIEISDAEIDQFIAGNAE